MTVQPLIAYIGQEDNSLQIIDLNDVEDLAVICPSVSVTTVPPPPPSTGGGGGLIMLLGIGLLGIVMTSKK